MTEYSKKQMDKWRETIKKRNSCMQAHLKAKDAAEARKHLKEAAKFDKDYAAIPQTIRLKIRSELGI